MSRPIYEAGTLIIKVYSVSATPTCCCHSNCLLYFKDTGFVHWTLTNAISIGQTTPGILLGTAGRCVGYLKMLSIVKVIRQINE
jgi:hypothetical protein